MKLIPEEEKRAFFYYFEEEKNAFEHLTKVFNTGYCSLDKKVCRYKSGELETVYNAYTSLFDGVISGNMKTPLEAVNELIEKCIGIAVTKEENENRL